MTLVRPLGVRAVFIVTKFFTKNYIFLPQFYQLLVDERIFLQYRFTQFLIGVAAHVFVR